MAALQRRGFLGLIGGAVAAGPSLASQISGPVTSMPEYAMASSIGSSAGISTQMVGSDWKASRIAEIKRWLSGEDSEIARQRNQDRLYQAEGIERHRLDGLKSVSSQHKARMLVDGNMDRQLRIRRMHMESELDSLLMGKF